MHIINTVSYLNAFYMSNLNFSKFNCLNFLIFIINSKRNSICEDALYGELFDLIWDTNKDRT